MGLLVTRKRFDELNQRDLDAWIRLLQKGALSSSLFMHPEFCDAANQTLDPVVVVTFEDQGRIVGVLPLNRTHGLRGWFRGYTQVAQAISDGFCFPVEDCYRNKIAFALTKAGIWSGFFTHFEVDRQIPNIQIGSITKTYLAQRQTDHGDMWSELKNRSKKFWSDTERCARRLKELPDGYAFHWRSPNPERDLEILISLKLDQYGRTGMYGAALFRKNIQTFLKTLISRNTDGYATLLNVLYSGDRLIAAHLGLFSGGRLHYWFPVYEPSFAKYSPGKVLLSEVMKHCSLLGVDVIDFGEGHADYKEAAATETRDLAKMVIAPGMRGALSMLPLRWAWRMNQRI